MKKPTKKRLKKYGFFNKESSIINSTIMVYNYKSRFICFDLSDSTVSTDEKFHVGWVKCKSMKDLKKYSKMELGFDLVKIK